MNIKENKDHSSQLSSSNKELESGISARLAILIGDESVSSFALKCGISESLVRKYLQGSIPGADKLVQVARGAGASLEWLATGYSEADDEIADRLARLIETGGGYRRFSEQTGIAPERVERLARGQFGPTPRELVTIANVYGLVIDWLVTGAEPMRKDEVLKMSPVNTGLLKAAAEAVESFLENNDMDAPAERRAALIAALYKYGEAKGMMQKGELTDFLRLVA